MAKRRSTSTIRSKSNAKLYIFAIILVIGVVALGSALIVFATGQELINIGGMSGVSVRASVSGNDFHIKILDEGRASELKAVRVSISGVSMSDDYCYKEIPKGSNDVIFEGIAYGVFGDREVVIKGIFKDGATAALLASNVYFG